MVKNECEKKRKARKKEVQGGMLHKKNGRDVVYTYNGVNVFWGVPRDEQGRSVIFTVPDLLRGSGLA